MRGSYLETTITSILFLGGLDPAIGVWKGGKPGGDGVQTGDIGGDLMGTEGNKWGSGEKASGLEGTEVSLSAKPIALTRGRVVKLGEGKSIGTLPKFEFLEAPADGVTGKWETTIGNAIGEERKLPESLGLVVELPSWRVLCLLIIFSGSALGVARGSCGVDLVCLPLEAITETMESPQWICQVHSCNLWCTKFWCTFKTSKICHSIPGKMFNSSPTTAP